MFDSCPLQCEGPSAFETLLRGWLEPDRPPLELIPARVRAAGEYRPHGRRTGFPSDPSVAADTTPDLGGVSCASQSAADVIEPGWRSIARRLEAGAAHLSAARSAYEEQCRQAAVQARALAAFAVERPASLLDRPGAEIGAAAAASRAARPAVLTAVSEWAVDEVMCALGLSSTAAAAVLTESVTLVEQLPATLAALESAQISWNHARMLTEVLAPLTEERRAAVEARLLSRAGGKTVSQLKVAARRAVLRADAAAAARRLAAAIRERNVRMFPGKDGMASLNTVLPTPVASACRKALEAYAEECQVPGDERTKDQRMADCLADLILRPGANGEPPVRIDLTVVASVGTLEGDDEPGEIDGHPVPAVLVRELAYSLGLLPRPPVGKAAEPESAHTRPAHTQPDHTRPADGTPPEGTTEDRDRRRTEVTGTDQQAARSSLADLLNTRATAGTALAGLPTIAIVDEISGQLLALTSTVEIRRAATCGRRSCRTGKTACTHPPDGAGLGPPPDSPGYSPSAALDRFVRARDRRCLFPGCRAAAVRCDLDHNVPWPAGTTSASNLCCLCRHHHRLSHQAPGWRMRRLPDGGLEWTTPGGDRLTTHPLRYGSDDDLPPPTHEATPSGPPRAPLTAADRVLGRPVPTGFMDTDPPPF